MTDGYHDNKVRIRAYELYEERGRNDGHALEDWRAAEEIDRKALGKQEAWQSVLGLFAEELAKLFYFYRNLLAADFGLQGSDGVVSWDEIMPSQRNLIIATARTVLLHLARQNMPFSVPLQREPDFQFALPLDLAELHTSGDGKNYF